MWIFIFKLALCSGITVLSWKIASAFDSRYGAIGLVVASVVWGITFARYLVELIPTIKYWAERSVLLRWQGRFYTFDNRQIRFYIVDETIWIPVNDLRHVMQPALNERELRLLGDAYGKIPEHQESGVSEAGLLRLLASRTEHRRASNKMIMFRNWLLQNALPNVRRLPESAANYR